MADLTPAQRLRVYATSPTGVGSFVFRPDEARALARMFDSLDAIEAERARVSELVERAEAAKATADLLRERAETIRRGQVSVWAFCYALLAAMPLAKVLRGLLGW